MGVAGFVVPYTEIRVDGFSDYVLLVNSELRSDPLYRSWVEFKFFTLIFS